MLTCPSFPDCHGDLNQLFSTPWPKFRAVSVRWATCQLSQALIFHVGLYRCSCGAIIRHREALQVCNGDNTVRTWRRSSGGWDSFVSLWTFKQPPHFPTFVTNENVVFGMSRLSWGYVVAVVGKDMMEGIRYWSEWPKWFRGCGISPAWTC